MGCKKKADLAALTVFCLPLLPLQLPTPMPLLFSSFVNVVAVGCRCSVVGGDRALLSCSCCFDCGK